MFLAGEWIDVEHDDYDEGLSFEAPGGGDRSHCCASTENARAMFMTDVSSDYACGGLGVFMKPNRYLSVCSGSIQRITRALDSSSKTCERR